MFTNDVRKITNFTKRKTVNKKKMDHRGRDIVIYVSDRGREAGENVSIITSIKKNGER